jgi:hypothetical protein
LKYNMVTGRMRALTVDAKLVAIFKEKSSIEYGRTTLSPMIVQLGGTRADYIAVRRLVGGKREWEMIKREFVPDVEAVGGEGEKLLPADPRPEERRKRPEQVLCSVPIDELLP